MKKKAEIKPVFSKREFRAFLKVPHLVNSESVKWIAPLELSIRDTLNQKKNPFWQNSKCALWVAWQDGKPVGRIMAIDNELFRQGEFKACGHFGFLEGIEDLNLFQQLTQTAENWLRERQCDGLMGPLNPGINYELGVLIQGFEQPASFMMSYNPAYYDPMLQACAYESEMDFVAYDLSTTLFQHYDKLQRVANYLHQKHEIGFRTVNVQRFQEECRLLRSIYNDAFQKHWAYVPFGEEEFLYMAKDMTQVLDPALLFFVEVNGETAGFIFALPDWNEAIQHVPAGKLFPVGFAKLLYYKRKIRRVRVINVAVKQQFMHLGLGSVLYAEMRRRMVEKGYIAGEMSWVAENNLPMNRAIQSLGGKVTKRYRVYHKKLRP